MGWKSKTALGVIGVIAVGYAGLSWITRDPDWPVTHIPVAGKLLLTGATVIDPATGAHEPNMTVLMEGGRIVSVTPAVGAPIPGAQIVDARGKFVVPGYNDMHAHPLNDPDPSGDFALMLANGVTGFRLMSASDAILDARAQSRLPLTRYAPALLATPGALLTPLNASKAEQAQQTVREQKTRGADFIKAAFVSGPVLFAAIDQAKRSGIPLAGHVPPGVSVVAAAERGMHAIEHLGPANGVLIACSRDGDRILADVRAQTKIPTMPSIKSHIVEGLANRALSGRVINPAAADHEAGGVAPMKRAMASFDAATCARSMARLKASGNWQVPTLIRLKTIYLADDPAFANNPNIRFMAPKKVDGWRDATAKFVKVYSPADRAAMRQGYAFSLKLVKLLDEAGVPMLAGSDASGSGWEVPGFALHQEFDELTKAGLTPLRILQMTTSDPATFLGKTAMMGSVAAGKGADLVVLDADPTENAANLHRIAAVVRAGFYYDAKALDALKERVAAGKGYLR